MPRYEYRCSTCGAVAEETRSFGDMHRLPRCPRDGEFMSKLVSVPAVAHVEGGTGAQRSDRSTSRA